MANYKLIIQYEGAKYSGWQKQGNTDNTIQSKIENVLGLMLKEEIEIHGAGRTDAGVHARGQVASFKTSAKVTSKEIVSYLNEYLPKDIKVLHCEKVDDRFHARLNAKGKHYQYVVYTGEKVDVFGRRTVAHMPGDYDIDKMNQAIKELVGTKDFKAYCDNKHMKKSTVRTIESITITKKGNYLLFDFLGDGFLYHMVRLLTGSLLLVGENKLEISQLKKELEAGYLDNRNLVQAAGLMLVEVFY